MSINLKNNTIHTNHITIIKSKKVIASLALNHLLQQTESKKTFSVTASYDRGTPELFVPSFTFPSPEVASLKCSLLELKEFPFFRITKVR
jgi:hypothetical protein